MCCYWLAGCDAPAHCVPTSVLVLFRKMEKCALWTLLLRASHLAVPWLLFCLAVEKFFTLCQTQGGAGGSFTPRSPGINKSWTVVASPCRCGHTHRASRRLKQQQQQQASTPLWGVESYSLPSWWPKPIDGPTQSQLSRPMSSRHHTSVEHRLRRKHLQLNSDSDASNGTFCERETKNKKKLFFLTSAEIHVLGVDIIW